MLEDSLSQRLEFAKEIALKAGQFALNKRQNQDFQISQKGLNDFVTTADKETEQLIFNAIKAKYPKDGFFGEESDSVDGEGRWVVDPIDGTTNFFRNLSNWAVSIAYEKEEGKPLVGVIYAPSLEALFYASKDGGAFKNGKEIKVSNIDDFKYSINVCVPPHRYKDLYSDYMEKFILIGNSSSDLRSYGSCALELSYIASGSIDSYYELCLGYYDFAAGKIILEEAGGSLIYKTNEATGRLDLLATNSKLNDWYEKNKIF
jgi:myo-inositol-1(or 4)-monophosphatase